MAGDVHVQAHPLEDIKVPGQSLRVFLARVNGVVFSVGTIDGVVGEDDHMEEPADELDVKI